MTLPSWIAQKYLALVSSRLERFKFTDNSNRNANFRCPYCGDSQKNKYKARGYFFEYKNDIMFKCHNCGITKGFTGFLFDHAPDLAKEMSFELFQENKKDVPSKEEKTRELFRKELKPKKEPLLLSLLKPAVESRNALLYLHRRKIRPEIVHKFYWTDDYREIYKHIPKYVERMPNEGKAGIVIPMFSRDRVLTHLQIRFIDPNDKQRYKTFEVHPTSCKAWGIEDIDPSRTVWVLEGAFDASFIDNAVAVNGAEVENLMEELQRIGCNDVRLVWDYDYRTNKEIFKKLKNVIVQGMTVVLLDSDFKGKDINEAVMNGFPQEMLVAYLQEHSFRGLAADLEVAPFNHLIQPKKNDKQKFQSGSKKKREAFQF